MIDTEKRLRFFVWAFVIMALVSTWLYVWKIKTEPEAERTAFTVAQRQILGSANTYRQDWMLNKQPQVLQVGEQQVHFTSMGWPITLRNNRMSCDKWLPLLWPDLKVFGQEYNVTTIDDEPGRAHCEYMFTHGQRVVIQLVNGAMQVKVKEP